MPVLLETNFILTLWLKQIPEYVVLFVRLVIMTALVDSLSFPLMTAALATGKIKRYQIIVGSTMMLNLPISYLFLKLGAPPQVTMYIALGVSAVCLSLRLSLLRKMVGLVVRDYVEKVLISIFSVSFIAYILPLFFIFRFEESLLRFLLISVTSLIVSIGTIYLIGISQNERLLINRFLKNKFIKA